MGTDGRVIGRADELGRLAALLADGRAGHGRALLLAGEAGIGKTTLLDAVSAGPSADLTVLRAAGVPGETEIAFSGLCDLLTPVTGYLSALPAPQSAALAAALALGPPVAGERLAVCVAAANLLRAAGRDRPVLVVVDDLQWLDAPSRECLLYAARRAAQSVAYLLAARVEEIDAAHPLGIPTLPVPPLTDRASRQVLARHDDLAPWVAEVVATASAGNPLALTELPRMLSARQRRGIDAVPWPLVPGTRLRAAFASRIGALRADTRQALLVAAVYEGDDVTSIAAACRRTGTDIVHLGAAEAIGLVRLDATRMVFGHPLMRGAVVASASPDQRRGAHRALADTLAGERRAWHLARATVAADETVAAALEQAGAVAAARRGFSAAATALERAARLSPEPPARVRRLLAAGRTAAAAGAPDRALSLLDDALAEADSGGLRGQVQHLRANVMVWAGSVEPAARLLEDEADRAAPDDRILAARMLADAAAAHTATGEYRLAERLAARATGMLGADGDAVARAHVLAVSAYVLALRGRTGRAADALAAAQTLAAGIDPLLPGQMWLHLIERTLVPIGELHRARDDAITRCGRARDAGAITTLAGSLVVAADAAFRLGDWVLADEASHEAVHVAQDAGQAIWYGMALTLRARLAAARGDQDGSRSAIDTAGAIADGHAIASGYRLVDGALGFLEIGLRRVPETIAALERVARFERDSGLREATTVPWVPDLVEAYLRAERIEDARRLVTAFGRYAVAGPPTAQALLARCQGMIAEDFDPPFIRALALHDQCPTPFERARTLLAYGRRLHRRGRRAQARVRLRDALDTFERLGAATWSEHARDELTAALARRIARPGEQLTAQERRIAAEVARGASNREIAAALFLAPKTVEFHLTRLYRKLGVGSRSQLVAVLAAENPPR
jgi:DNA-binding CsgD family transcriptional regulator